MTAGEIAALIAAVAVAVLVVALLCVLVSLIATLRSLRETTDELRRSAVPLVAEMRVTVGQASAQLERVDQLLGSAEHLTTTMDSASKLAYMTFSNPAIKAIAVGTGAARARRRLRKDSDSNGNGA